MDTLSSYSSFVKAQSLLDNPPSCLGAIAEMQSYFSTSSFAMYYFSALGQILLGIVIWCSFIASTRKRMLKPSNAAKSTAIGR